MTRWIHWLVESVSSGGVVIDDLVVIIVELLVVKGQGGVKEESFKRALVTTMLKSRWRRSKRIKVIFMRMRLIRSLVRLGAMMSQLHGPGIGDSHPIRPQDHNLASPPCPFQMGTLDVLPGGMPLPRGFSILL